MMCFSDHIVALIIILEMLVISTSSREDYSVEHEISQAQANQSAAKFDLNANRVPPGCQKCTRAEKYYCLSSNFMNDHCCCDKRFNEVLSFIPHTCYVGATLCKTVASDCAEYTRLRKCCCENYVLQKWAVKPSASSSFRLQKTSILLIIFTVNMYL